MSPPEPSEADQGRDHGERRGQGGWVHGGGRTVSVSPFWRAVGACIAVVVFVACLVVAFMVNVATTHWIVDLGDRWFG